MTKSVLFRARHPFLSIPLFCMGGILYYLIELAFRGWSHWTMAVCGGICLVAIYHVNRWLFRSPLLLRALCGSLIITTVEFAAGCILNLWLNMKIWSYTGHALNLLGQICPYMSFLWFLLSIPVCLLCTVISRLADGASLVKPLGGLVRRHAMHKSQQNVRGQQGRASAGNEGQRQAHNG